MKILISHGDVDGIVSAVIIDSVENLDLIKFSAPYKLHTDLGYIIENVKCNFKLFISDISCVDYASKNLIKLITISGNEVYYFDHHDYSIKVNDVVKEYIFDTRKSCARIVFDYYNIKNEHLSKLTTIADIAEKFSNDKHLEKEYELLDYSLSYSVDDDKFRLLLIDELKHKMPSEISEVKKRHKLFKVKLNNAYKIVKKRIIYEDEDKVISLLSDVESKEVRGYVSKVTSKISRRMNKKLAVTIFRPNIYEYVITMRTYKHSNVNVGLIIECIKKEFGGKGGGHRRAGSIAVSDSVIDKVIEKIKKLNLR